MHCYSTQSFLNYNYKLKETPRCIPPSTAEHASHCTIITVYCRFPQGSWLHCMHSISSGRCGGVRVTTLYWYPPPPASEKISCSDDEVRSHYHIHSQWQNGNGTSVQNQGLPSWTYLRPVGQLGCMITHSAFFICSSSRTGAFAMVALMFEYRLQRYTPDLDSVTVAVVVFLFIVIQPNRQWCLLTKRWLRRGEGRKRMGRGEKDRQGREIQ